MAGNDKIKDRGDPTAELLKEAGPRPPLPPLDLESLGAPALAAWQKRTEKRRQRRRRALFAVAALGLLACAAVLLRNLQSREAIGIITAAHGSSFDVGAEILAGSRVGTSLQPAEGVAIALTGGHHIRLDAGTELELKSATRLDLIRGAIYIEAQEAPLYVHAAGVVSEHIGTRYEVRLEQEEAGPRYVRVRVREGRVRIRPDENTVPKTVEIEGGEQASGGAEGWVIEPIEIHGPSWLWIRRAAPPFDSDGASLASFLRWVEHESGWRVEVDSSLLVKPDGEDVLVQGAIAGSSLEEALAIVLGGSDLEYELDDGQLIVRETAVDPQ